MTNKKALIEAYCEMYGAKYVEGTLGRGPFMVLAYKTWEIVLDYHTVSTGNSSVTYTRVRSILKNPKEFELKLGREGFLSKVGKAFGGQDIEIGDELFDADHLIKSNDELLTTRLLNDFEIKSRINFSKNFSLDIVHKNSMGIKCDPGESGLIFYTIGKLKHEAELVNVVELFQHILDCLTEMNITTETRCTTVMYKEKKK